MRVTIKVTDTNGKKYTKRFLKATSRDLDSFKKQLMYLQHTGHLRVGKKWFNPKNVVSVEIKEHRIGNENF